MEEHLCLAKKLQTFANCSKIDLLLFATYFLIPVLKEVDPPWREYIQQEDKLF